MKKALALIFAAVVLLSGCARKDTTEKDISLDSIMEAIQDVYGEDYLPNTDMPQDLLETEFGISSDMAESYRAQVPLISTHPDCVVIVKAAPGKADDVEAALKNARDRKINNEMQYPMNVAKTNAALVERHGNYVAFLLVGAPDDRLEADDAQRAAYAREEVQKAADAFKAMFE